MPRSTNRPTSQLNLHGATPWDIHHRWDALMGGLLFITLWRNDGVIAVTSEADHHVQSFVAMKNAGIASGHDDLVDADWVHKWQAFLDHFSPHRASRSADAWNSLPRAERTKEAALSSIALMRELEKRRQEGFTWNTPIQTVIDKRIQSYGMADDETRVVWVGDNR